MYIFEALGQTDLGFSTFNTVKWVDKELAKDPAKTIKDHRFLIQALNQMDNIHVLDFGGSLGFGYRALIMACPEKNIKYSVVETPLVCDAARQCYDSPNIAFEDNLTSTNNVDIVYIRTSLQYAAEWKETLNALVSLEPSIFVFAHISAGPIRTFQAIQNYYGRKVPYWWISLTELKQVMKEYGYACTLEEDDQLIDDSAFCSSIDDQDRLTTTKNLVFRRAIA